MDWEAIKAAARKLEEGKIVAFPTETVYGLGADAENPEAVANIYKAKGRPANHPVIVHIAPEAKIEYWAETVPPEAYQLIEAFWPGPLTLIVKRAAHVPDIVSGGQDSVGVRCPSHPVAQALLREFKSGLGGLAGPSANKFGHVSPTTAEHVREEFKDTPLVDAVLEGGESEVGIESTILDVSRVDTHGVVLLRPGQITVDQIEEVLGTIIHAPDLSAPRASGTLKSHYAPNTPVVQIAVENMTEVAAALKKAHKRVAVIARTASALLVDEQLQMPENAPDYARRLYAALRDMDHSDADIILVESLPVTTQWQGVNDRLRRAAYDSLDILNQWHIAHP